MTVQNVSVGDIEFGNDKPFVLVGGVNVLESEQFAVDVVQALHQMRVKVVRVSLLPRLFGRFRGGTGQARHQVLRQADRHQGRADPRTVGRRGPRPSHAGDGQCGPSIPRRHA